MSEIERPVILSWSALAPFPARSRVWNTGCPPGYFAEFVPREAPGATPLDNGVEGVRCRLVTRDAALLAAEALSWEDTLDNLNAALSEIETPPAPPSPIWWLSLGLLGLGLWGRVRGARRTG